MSRLLTDPLGSSGFLSLMLAASLALTGCATHYQPRSGHRLSVVMEGGSLAYHRNGETINHGFFGGGLVDAVEDDPAAREAAETYRGRTVGGFVSLTAGFVCFLGGSAWAVSQDSSSNNGFFDSDSASIFLAATGCFLAGAVTGSVLIMSAQPYHWDAINIYNDNAEARAYRYPPPPSYGGPAPRYLPAPPPAATQPAAPAQPPPPAPAP